MLVELTQFKLPDGHEVPVTCEVADDLREKYELVRENRLRLTAEILTTGEISLAIEHKEGDVMLELAENGPGDHAPNKVLERMLRDFSQEALDVWLEENEIE